MRLTIITLAAAVALTSTAFAEPTAPGNIKFGENGEVELALTDVAGDAASGRKLFMNRKKGNCLACHVNSDMAEQTFHGEVGPELDGVADRWDTAELRGILVNSKNMFEGTIMPAFYRDSGYNRICSLDYYGRSYEAYNNFIGSGSRFKQYCVCRTNSARKHKVWRKR